MKSLSRSDEHHLRAAEGWVELGNYFEATQELEQITPQLRAHPFVLEVRYKIYEVACRWESALEIANAMSRILPDNSWGPFHSAFCLHELNKTQAAYDALAEVINSYPNEYMMLYNMACYSCRLARRKEAMHWLEKAIDAAGQNDIREMALEDPDLEELWTHIGEI